jgi:hypothetical protein
MQLDIAEQASQLNFTAEKYRTVVAPEILQRLISSGGRAKSHSSGKAEKPDALGSRLKSLAELTQLLKVAKVSLSAFTWYLESVIPLFHYHPRILGSGSPS